MEQYASGSVMARGGRPLQLVAAGTVETASTAHGSLITGPDGGSLFVTVAVTAASGTTPTLTVVIEGSQDAVNWTPLATVGANGYAPGSVDTAPANITAAVSANAYVPSPAFVRARSVVGGTTPSFTYGVTAIPC